ncbi:MAG: DUF1643 domain-containing protein [Rhodoferax sp.]|uniref:DUF1643 domain-containing protein n=1 Tax=Rhodoferax sp. TaxID=50421 RepID=UPI003BAF1C62
MRYEHIDGVEVSAQFSSEGESRYRNRLDITLNGAASAGKTVCAVMQNPSYAGEDVADKSVQFLEKVVFKKGLPEFDGVRRLIVVNQFAYIQTNDFEGLPNQIGALNDATIRAALHESDIVVLAWGSSNRFEARKAFVHCLLGSMNHKALFKTRMHPSRGRYDGFIQPFVHADHI